MKPNVFLSFLLCVTITVSSALAGGQSAPRNAPVTKPPPGIELAQTISMITGVAISPLLGVSAVGAWKYFKTPSAQRPRLPWFAQPWFWFPALLLVTAVFAKDSLGPVIPTALKKPFDLAELLENKLSALVAAGAFVPLVVSVFPNSVSNEPSAANELVWATISLGDLGNILLTPFAILAFAVVWLAAHTINILILVSPFGTVDAALKAFRLFLLSTVTATSFANPYVGAAWALVIMLVCYLLVGWSFRMLVFGTVFAWDIITGARKRYLPGFSEVRVFTSRKIQQIPTRTWGRLARNPQGQLVFAYRPWLIMTPRIITLPVGNFAVGRGLIHPSLLLIQGGSAQSLFHFPPRCRTHEEKLAETLGCSEVRDIGLRGVWKWILELFGYSKARVRESAVAT